MQENPSASAANGDNGNGMGPKGAKSNNGSKSPPGANSSNGDGAAGRSNKRKGGGRGGGAEGGVCPVPAAVEPPPPPPARARAWPRTHISGTSHRPLEPLTVTIALMLLQLLLLHGREWPRTKRRRQRHRLGERKGMARR